MEFGIDSVATRDAEGQLRVLERFLAGQEPRGSRRRSSNFGVGGVAEGELTVAEALGVVAGLAFIEPQVKVLLEEPGEQFADEQDDEAGVREPEAELPPGEGSG
jgi:hypothetical protein